MPPTGHALIKCGVWVFEVYKLYMLALVGRPSLHRFDACFVYWVQEASQRNCRQGNGQTSFSPKNVFCLVEILIIILAFGFWAFVDW